jgi:choline-sulfatase
LNNLAGENLRLSSTFREEIAARFNIDLINHQVLESQQSRLMMFEALKRGARFPWDFQPLRDASEQYTRNHMSVTDRDLQSRFPPAPKIEGKQR